MSQRTAEELVHYLEVWDQTIGCSLCGEAWWGENETEDITLFHKKDCELYGRHDVLEVPDGNVKREKDLREAKNAKTR